MNLDEMQTYIHRINSDLVIVRGDIEELKRVIEGKQLTIEFQKSEIANLREQIKVRDERIIILETINNEMETLNE